MNKLQRSATIKIGQSPIDKNNKVSPEGAKDLPQYETTIKKSS